MLTEITDKGTANCKPQVDTKNLGCTESREMEDIEVQIAKGVEQQGACCG